MKAEHKQHPAPYGMIALVIGGMIIGLSAIFVRLSPVGPTATAFYRLALALPLLLLCQGIGGRSRTPESDRPPRPKWYFLLLPGLFFALDITTWHWSIHFTSVANSTLLGNAAPIVVTLVAWLYFKEHITKRFLVGMGSALLGMVLLMGDSLQISAQHVLGDLLALVTAVLYAGYQLSINRLRHHYSALTLMNISAGTGALLLFFITWLTGDGFLWTEHWMKGLLALLGLAWLCHAVGQGLIVYGMKRVPASFASVTLLLQPVVTAIMGWLVLGEYLSGIQLIGGVIVLIGIVLSRRGSALSRQEAT